MERTSYSVCADYVDVDIVADMYEVKDKDGSVRYIDELTYFSELKERTDDLYKLLHIIQENNPLKFCDLCESTDISVSSINDSAVIDDFSEAMAKRKQNKNRRFSLKRSVITLGIALGILAAAKNAPRYFVDTNNHVSIQSEPTFESNNSHMNISNKIKSKIKKLSFFNNNDKEITTLKDYIQLEDVKLYSSSDGETPTVGVRKLDCDSYQIRRIAILSHDGKSILKKVNMNEIDKSTSIEEFKDNCRLLYGNDVKFQMNVDGFANGKKVYEEIGWTSIENIKPKNSGHKVYRKAR